MLRPAAHRETSADAVAGVLLRDRVSKQTIPPEPCYHPRVGHRERRSTIAPSSSFLALAPKPVHACRRHAACWLPSHSAAALLPGAPATYCTPRPSPLASIVPVPLLVAHKFGIADKEEDGRHIWRSTHGPAIPVPPFPAQSVGSERPLAQSVGSVDSSVSGVHDGLPESILASIPTSPIHLPQASATLRRNRDTPSVAFHAFVFHGADAPAADAAPVLLSQSARKMLRIHSRCAALPEQLAPVADLLTAAPAVRSVAPASPTCVRTASAAVG